MPLVRPGAAESSLRTGRDAVDNQPTNLNAAPTAPQRSKILEGKLALVMLVVRRFKMYTMECRSSKARCTVQQFR